MHYQQREGQLGIWGTIQRYVYHYAPDSALVLRTDGSVEKEVPPPAHPRASVSARGRPLSLRHASELSDDPSETD